MNTNELEKKLVKLVEYKLKDTMLNLIYDLSENPAEKTFYIIPNKVVEIKKRLDKAYLDLSNSLDTSDRKIFEAELDNLSKDIVECGININRYVNYNDKIGRNLIRTYKLNDIKTFVDNVPLNNSTMLSAIKESVSKLPDNFELNYKMADLISVLPLRMTRQRYSQYVKDSITLLSTGLPSDFLSSSVERLKDMFFSSCEKSFELDFPLMYQKLEAISSDLTNLNNKEIEEHLEDLDNNVENLHSIFSLLSMYFNDVTYMKILSIFAVDKEFLFNDDMLLKDLYYSLYDALNKNDNSFIEDILERCEQEISERFELTKPLEEEISTFVNNLENVDELSNDVKLSLQVNNQVSEMFFNELDQQIMLNNTSNKTLDELSQSLVDYIDEITENMTNNEKKLLKQDFLKNIPCPLSKDDFFTYCAYSLDGINDKSISLLAYGNIFQITDELNEKMQNSPHSHSCNCGDDHSHSHSHSCNCGDDHSHSHSHSCDCGHHH